MSDQPEDPPNPPSSNVIDFEQARNKRLPFDTFAEMPEDEDPNQWVVQLFEEDGTPVRGRTGINFGFEGCPMVSISAEQCRELGSLLLKIADFFDQPGDTQ